MKKLAKIFTLSTILLVAICCLACCNTNECRHEWIPATCIQPKTCSICQTTEGQPNGHEWSEATCSLPQICSVCSQTSGEALGHNFENNICTTCGFKLSEKLTYKINSSNSGYILMSIGDVVYNSFEIPSIYKNLPVTGIYEKAFMDCIPIKTITIPATVVAIGPSAFENCINLQNVYFEENSALVSLGARVFANCKSLKEIHLPETLRSMGHYVFHGCSSLQKMTVAYAGTTINANNSPDNTNAMFAAIFGMDSFENSYYVKPYYVPSSLVEITILGGRIQANAISGLKSVTKITIGENVTHLDPNFVQNCNKLIELFNFSPTMLSKKQLTTYNENLKYLYTDKNQQSKIQSIEDYSVFIDQQQQEYIILAYEGTDHVLKLPEGINGNKYAIFDYAFISNRIESVYINSYVSSIGLHVFGNDVEVYLPDIETWLNIECDTFMEGVNNPTFYLNGVLLTNLVIPSTVSEINSNAFWGCLDITSVTILPNSQLTKIGDYAFANCYNLTEFIADTNSLSLQYIGQSAFNGCHKLKAFPFDICHNLKEIGSQAFVNCTQITNVLFSDQCDLQRVGISAFAGCNNLKFNTEKNLLYLGSTANPYMVLHGIEDYSITHIPVNENTKVICIEAPRTKDNVLKSIYIPSSVKYISTNFYKYYFYFLDNLYISDLNAWCDIEFANYYSNPLIVTKNLIVNNQPVSSINLPDTVTTIKDYAFFALPDSITQIYIPASITTIGVDAFTPRSLHMHTPKSVYIKNLTAWCNVDFATEQSNPLAYNDMYILSTETNQYVLTKDLIIPAEVTEIKQFAFANNSTISSLSFADNAQLTVIGSHAFYYCTELKSITLPVTLTHVYDYAFYYARLKEITIPAEVQYIGTQAFVCATLTSVTFEAPSNWSVVLLDGTANKIDFSTPNQNAGLLQDTTVEYFIINENIKKED